MSEQRFTFKEKNGAYDIFDNGYNKKIPFASIVCHKDSVDVIVGLLNEQQDQISYWKHKVNSLLFILGQFDEEKVKGLLKEMEQE